MIVSVIGCGSIGRRHLKGLLSISKSASITEVRGFDPDPSRIDQVQLEISGVKTFDALETCIFGADVLFICAPTSLHMTIYNQIKAIGSYHLFIEKPLSHNLDGCDQILFDQEVAKKHSVIGYMLRLHPVMKKAKEIIDSNKLGRVISVRAECGAYLPLWHPWERYQDFYMSWKVGGGGALLDISHEIDYLNYLFGDIEDLQGIFGTYSDLEITSDDLAIAILKFKNGIIGQLQLDLLQHSRERSLKIIGTEGILKCDFINNKIDSYILQNECWESEAFVVDFDSIYHEEYLQFFNEIKGSKKMLANLKDGIKVMQVIEGIRTSSSSGNRIKLPIY